MTRIEIDVSGHSTGAHYDDTQTMTFPLQVLLEPLNGILECSFLARFDFRVALGGIVNRYLNVQV